MAIFLQLKKQKSIFKLYSKNHFRSADNQKPAHRQVNMVIFTVWIWVFEIGKLHWVILMKTRGMEVLGVLHSLLIPNSSQQNKQRGTGTF